MANMDFDELAARIDGVAWVLMSLIAQLEMDRRLDGDRFCDNLRNTAEGRGRFPGLERSAGMIRRIADDIDAARSARQTLGRPN